MLGDVDKTHVIEVAQSDGPCFAGLIGFFHSPIGAIAVTIGLMHQQQVDIVGAQFAQAIIDAYCRTLLAGVADPHLGGDEQLVARDAALLDGSAHTLFILIVLGGVDTAVAHLDGFQHAALAFGRGEPEYAKSQHRHLHTIVQLNCFHMEG